MQKRIKYGLAAFLIMVAAFAIMVVFDYTDNYVGDRFVRAVEVRRTTPGDTFSLDAMIGYYDWDSVCVVLPETEHEFKKRLGRKYAHKATNIGTWSLIFIKGDRVEIEIPVERTFLEHPEILDDPCFDRWAAIFSIDMDQNGHPRLTVGGH